MHRLASRSWTWVLATTLAWVSSPLLLASSPDSESPAPTATAILVAPALLNTATNAVLRASDPCRAPLIDGGQL